jgi:hypothetical protein
MATRRDTVDAALGRGWYDQWQKMELDVMRLRSRTAVNNKRYSAIRAPEATDWLWSDARLLEAVATDFRNAMNRIARRQSVDKRKVGQMYDVLSLALGVVQHDNDALDAGYAAGIVAGFVALPLKMFQQTAGQLTQLLQTLRQQLEKAKKERTEAWVQTGINTALTVITALSGPIGLLGRGVIAAGQWVLDDALGPKTSTAATAGSKTSISVSQLGEAAAQAERLGSKVQRIGKAAGGTATVTGFVFDVNEILIGYRNVEQVRTAMSKAKRAYDQLIAQIKKHRPAIQKFQRDYQKWQVAIKSIRENATRIRNALRDELKQTGYKPKG